jgi:hypothetical protein
MNSIKIDKIYSVFKLQELNAETTANCKGGQTTTTKFDSININGQTATKSNVNGVETKTGNQSLFDMKFPVLKFPSFSFE